MFCKRTKQARTSRLVYNNPEKRNHIGAVEISISFPPAMAASKLLAITIGLSGVRMNMQALVAGLGGVSRRYNPYSYACPNGFVFQKLPQLIERPTI
jgi:hypothetical protein